MCLCGGYLWHSERENDKKMSNQQIIFRFIKFIYIQAGPIQDFKANTQYVFENLLYTKQSYMYYI